MSTTWHLVFLRFHTKKTCIDGCLSSHSCRKTRPSDSNDPSLFFMEVVTSEFSRRFRMLQAWWDSQLAMPWQVRLRIKQSFHAQRQGADAASQHVMLLKSHRRSKLDCRRHSWHPKNPSIIHRKSVKIPQNTRKSLKILENWLSGKFNWVISWGSQRFSSAYDNWMGFSCHAQRPLSFWLHHQASSRFTTGEFGKTKPFGFTEVHEDGMIWHIILLEQRWSEARVTKDFKRLRFNHPKGLTGPCCVPELPRPRRHWHVWRSAAKWAPWQRWNGGESTEFLASPHIVSC